MTLFGRMQGEHLTTSATGVAMVDRHGSSIEHDSPEVDPSAVDPTAVPSVLRALFASTPLDSRIDALPPPGERRIRAATRALRWYRRRLAPRLGNRCVYDPSCSRFAELAVRRRGLAIGMTLTARRLLRCRGGRGGLDLPTHWMTTLEEPSCDISSSP